MAETIRLNNAKYQEILKAFKSAKEDISNGNIINLETVIFYIAAKLYNDTKAEFRPRAKQFFNQDKSNILTVREIEVRTETEKETDRV